MLSQHSNANASQISYENFLRFYDRIPSLERDIYKYYCIFNLGQVEIADITGLTQGAISHRLAKLRARVTFLETLDRLCEGDSEKIFKELKQYCDPFEIALLKAVYRTTSQSYSAHILNTLFNLTGAQAMNQIKIKYQFSKILSRLKGTGYFRIFKYIDEGWYMLSEVRLPHFDRRHDA